MKILNKIKAFFKFKGETQQMEVTKAKIGNEGVFLYPINDPEHIFFVRSKSVDVFINNDEALTDEDIVILDKKQVNDNSENGNTNEEKSKNKDRTHNISSRNPWFIKRRFSVMLYQDEYEVLMKNIKENGYKRTEYFLACVNSVNKRGFQSSYKKYTEEHRKRYLADKNEQEITQENNTNIKENKKI